MQQHQYPIDHSYLQPYTTEMQMHNMYASQIQTMHQPPSSVPNTGSRRFTGIVKSFSNTNGYGFVTSQEILDAFTQDVFIHQLEVDKVMGMPKSNISCGTAISFTVVQNKRGQPQARDVELDQSCLSMGGGSHVSPQMGGMGGPLSSMSAYMGYPPMTNGYHH